MIYALELKLSVCGEGFLGVQLPDDSLAFARQGVFVRDSEGRLVTEIGAWLRPSLSLPEQVQEVVVDGQSGEIKIRKEGQSLAIVGRVEIAKFENPAGLHSIGYSLFKATQASGEAAWGFPGAQGRGILTTELRPSLLNSGRIEELI